MIEIPERMKALPVYKGLPVPYIVQWDAEGVPLFAVNDAELQRKAARKKLCETCGQRLPKELWFVGGPRSAFHPYGAFFDSAMHHDCMTYALKVCPHLARVRFHSTLDARLPVLEKRLGDENKLMIDHTQDPKRPEIFVAVMSYGQQIESIPGMTRALHLTPLRPYHGVEFWRHGQQIPFNEGVAISLKSEGVTRKSLNDALRLLPGGVKCG